MTGAVIYVDLANKSDNQLRPVTSPAGLPVGKECGGRDGYGPAFGPPHRPEIPAVPLGNHLRNLSLPRFALLYSGFNRLSVDAAGVSSQCGPGHAAWFDKKRSECEALQAGADASPGLARTTAGPFVAWLSAASPRGTRGICSARETAPGNRTAESRYAASSIASIAVSG
ncbi:hypothetical protein MANY_36700 [Mycolicibacterium anyangense]|uniref:Uncharacterized protein n=1 Tax=Mycolicibacterium anyangense TaxID=1431246 RepID=A0A6N4WD70_9MYCO|nr:hypothetical protein MANY_36700 [Mycolicibacterium anyangense]